MHRCQHYNRSQRAAPMLQGTCAPPHFPLRSAAPSPRRAPPLCAHPREERQEPATLLRPFSTRPTVILAPAPLRGKVVVGSGAAQDAARMIRAAVSPRPKAAAALGAPRDGRSVARPARSPTGLSVVITQTVPGPFGIDVLSRRRDAGGRLGRSGCPSRNRAADSGRGGAACLSAETKLPRPEPLLLL